MSLSQSVRSFSSEIGVSVSVCLLDANLEECLLDVPGYSYWYAG